MTPARSILPLWLLASSGSAALLAACGGTVVFEEDGGDGGGSVNVAQATTVGPGQGGGTSFASSGITTSVSSGGGGPASSSIVASSSSGGGGDCASRNIYTACLQDSTCVPIFDDACCSNCFPGEGCADCVDFQFVGCTDRLPPEPDGTCGANPCGSIPYWACAGGAPACEDGCFDAAGCVEHVTCGFDSCTVECRAAQLDACGPVNCDAPTPACNEGQVAEASNGCWTGACIPAWVCSPMPPL